MTGRDSSAFEGRTPDRRRENLVASARSVIGLLSRHLNADVAVELWNGEVIPIKPGARDDVRIVIGSSAALRRLLLKPNISTIAELFAYGDLDIAGAHPIDAMRRGNHLEFKHLPKKINRAGLLRAALPLLVDFSSQTKRQILYAATGVSRSQRKDNEFIKFHYDLSNAFYALFLDQEMTYSSAYFSRPDMTLDEAQLCKLETVCQKLRLSSADRLLDPGCGWGSLICYAAQHHGVRSHGMTLSQAQFDFCSAKISRLGLQDRVTIELRDCRTLNEPGSFDKVAQIEMLEHIGIDNHDAFYKWVHRQLRPRGLYLGQASARRATRDLSKFRQQTVYMRFITDYVFPGGELDHPGMTVANLERNGFEVHDLEALREHFHLTCETWSRRLYARREAAAGEVGWPKTRLWYFYLALCALSFERGALSIFQVLASKWKVGRSEIARSQVGPGRASPTPAR